MDFFLKPSHLYPDTKVWMFIFECKFVDLKFDDQWTRVEDDILTKGYKLYGYNYIKYEK